MAMNNNIIIAKKKEEKKQHSEADKRKGENSYKKDRIEENERENVVKGKKQEILGKAV